ncbi:hypothetical protein Tco_0130656, partial [Tanacetum coccineum]
MLQGCHIFLAHITIKETVDKSKKKQLQDVPIVKNFPKVFPKDFPGLPHTRQVEFHIDLVPGAAPVARAPYRLADQLQEHLKIILELLKKEELYAKFSKSKIESVKYWASPKIPAKPYPISQGLMELQERSRVYMGTRRSILEEIPTFVLKDRAVVKCRVAQLTGGDYNTSYF